MISSRLTVGSGTASDRLEEYLDVEEGRVPDRALRAHDGEEGDQHALEVVALAERLAQRRLGDLAVLLELL